LHDEPAPQQRLVLVGEQAHREQLDATASDVALERLHFSRERFDLAVDAEQAGQREAPDVGVEDTDRVAALGEGHRQVRGDGRLADAALARGDHQDRGLEGDRGPRSPLLGEDPRPAHQVALGVGVEHAQHEIGFAYAVEREDRLAHVAFDLVLEGAAGGRERHVHYGPAPIVDGDVAHHAQFDDGRAQFGVEHLGEAGADVVGEGHLETLPVIPKGCSIAGSFATMDGGTIEGAPCRT
jgi:hypothetical protein